MNWYIGQDIVCINSKGARNQSGQHSGLIEGKVYAVKRLSVSNCKCKTVIIDVGILSKTGEDTGICSICNKHGIFERTISWWFGESRFAPLEYDQQAIEELLKIEQPIKK